MDIVLASDHAAYEEKEMLKKHLLSLGHHPIDVGTNSIERCDYPDYAKAGAVEVLKRNCLGVFLCGSGIGISMAANRYAGIRAALCRSPEEAQLSKQHNDANVLCLGGRVNTADELIDITNSWLAASFEGGRHIDRVSKFNALGTKL